ncbi:type I glyceraldehyde-3-phosphate dehydrogenase [Candidatus Gottesmanbacteria bacterium]|nr:type I glyceraldehyde-3-phosphate dehydrogenase [Candidatus Gottesmanbacteria bacterium]
MGVCIGINGFGRIGRCAARIILSRSDLTLAAINSNSDVASHAYLLRHDSVYGLWHESVFAEEDILVSGNHRIRCFQAADASNVPWGAERVDIVLECTGKSRTTELAGKHIRESVQRVVISAPAKDATPTYIMGVNHLSYSGEPIISNSSCTTNCVATVLKVLDDALGVIRGNMTTIHAVTDSQNLLDNSHKKNLRLRRSALVNLIPTASGSGKDVSKIFPHLAGRLPCRSVRVPVPAVSMIDLVVEVKKKTSVDSVNRLFILAAKSGLKNALAVAEEELVSTDYIGSPFSSVIDSSLTDVADGTLVHVSAWYDNEWGYANRLVDMAAHIMKKT